MDEQHTQPGDHQRFVKSMTAILLADHTGIKLSRTELQLLSAAGEVKPEELTCARLAAKMEKSEGYISVLKAHLKKKLAAEGRLEPKSSHVAAATQTAAGPASPDTSTHDAFITHVRLAEPPKPGQRPKLEDAVPMSWLMQEDRRRGKEWDKTKKPEPLEHYLHTLAEGIKDVPDSLPAPLPPGTNPLLIALGDLKASVVNTLRLNDSERQLLTACLSLPEEQLSMANVTRHSGFEGEDIETLARGILTKARHPFRPNGHAAEAGQQGAGRSR